MNKAIRWLVNYGFLSLLAVGAAWMVGVAIERSFPDPDRYTITSLNVNGEVLTCIQLNRSTLSCDWANINKEKNNAN